jgi:hypothetical protein
MVINAHHQMHSHPLILRANSETENIIDTQRVIPFYSIHNAAINEHNILELMLARKRHRIFLANS